MSVFAYTETQRSLAACHAAWAAAEDRRRELLVATARELSEKPIHGADESHLIRCEN